jgi:hypothetical protein
LKKCPNRLMFHTFYLVISKLMRRGLRIQFIALMWIPIRTVPFNLMRINADRTRITAK